MKLPNALHEIVEAALEGVPLAELQRASERLTQRYRGEIRDGSLHIADDLSARAYLAVRMPATYAAIRAGFEAAAQLRPDFVPASLLDIGSGPGTALIAALNIWPEIADAELIEASSAIRHWGERLVGVLSCDNVRWRAEDVARARPERKFDLVTAGYLLDELPSATIASLVLRAWEATAGMLMVIEPGTPAGWARILAVREQLIGLGAHIVAPCPHAFACPVVSPDWCHFSQRVQRSRMHRRIKSADVPWEDEKFIYLAASREEGMHAQARAIAPPMLRGGTVTLTRCNQDGTRTQPLLSRRDGKSFAQARRLDWGDAIFPSDSSA
ncbi:MAG: small ribosomal subunit Rsm22 family protein [Pseudorhodoplanes sp.]